MKQALDHRELSQLLASLGDENAMHRLLQDFFTPQELEDLVLRWEIIKLLNAGLTQREIARELGVAIGTVSRGARALKYGHEGFSDLLSRRKSAS